MDFPGKLSVVLDALNVDDRELLDLAKRKIGIHRSTVSTWRNGVATPSKNNRVALARALQLRENIFDSDIEDILSELAMISPNNKREPDGYFPGYQEKFLGRFVLLRYAFSGYGTSDVYLIQSALEIKKAGSILASTSKNLIIHFLV